MKTRTPNEIFRDLANAIANAIEHPECPRELAEALSEAINPLENLLAGSGSGYSIIATTLRALANEAANGKPVESRSVAASA